eukprot:s579_g28.t1
MAAFRYQMTFIDEVAEPTAEVIRTKSCPPVLNLCFQSGSKVWVKGPGKQPRKTPKMTKDATSLDFMHQRKRLALQVSKLQERSQLLSTEGALSPNDTGAPRGEASEVRIRSFDKQQRDFLKLLPSVTFLEMILPYVRKAVEASELPGACRVLQLLESEIVVRAPGGTKVQMTPRRIQYVLERMSLANLVSLICSTLRGRFPKLMANELKTLRETAKILES